VPSNRKILKSSSISESPGKSGWPVTISGMIVPTDQMSTGTEYCFPPSRISGARYLQAGGRVGAQTLSPGRPLEGC